MSQLYGIDITNGVGIAISDCIIHKTIQGVHLHNSSDALIDNTLCMDSTLTGTGIWVDSSSHVVLDFCHNNSFSTGVLVNASSDIKVNSCEAYGNSTYGIADTNNTGPVLVQGCKVANNGGTTGFGFYFVGSALSYYCSNIATNNGAEPAGNPDTNYNDIASTGYPTAAAPYYRVNIPSATPPMVPTSYWENISL